MTPKAAQAKGKRLETYLLNHFRKEIDANSYQPKGSGNGEEKSDIVVPSANIVIEAKNQKALHVMDWLDQVRTQNLNDMEPVVIFRNPRQAEFKDTLVVVSLGHYTKLLQGNSEAPEVSTVLNYEQRSAMSSLKTALSRVAKVFDHE